MKQVSLTKKEKFVIIAGIGILIIGFFAYMTFAGTNIGISLKSVGGLNNGLVAYWTFDGTAGNILADSSGNGNNGTFINGATSTAFGKVGQAIKFSGIDNGGSAFDVPNSSSIQTNTSMSVAFWIKGGATTTLNDFGSFFGKDDARPPGWRIQNAINTDNMYMRIDTSAVTNSTSNTNLPGTLAGQWHHVVYTVDASQTTGTEKGYQDGVLVDTTTFASGTGIDNGSSPLHFKAGLFEKLVTLDDVRIYNRVLSASEVKRLYDMGNTTHIDVSQQSSGTLPGASNPNSGLISYWTFDGKNMTSNVADLSGQGNTGYLRSFTSTTTQNGKIGQALQFNGVNNYVIGTNTVNISTVTESIWVKFSSTPASKAFIAGFSNGLGAGQFDKDLYLNTNGTVNWYVFDGVGKSIDGTRVITDGMWHHIVGTANGSISALYVDNILDGTIAAGATYTSYNTANVFVNGANGSGSYLNDLIDDFRVYNYALSTSSIQRLYQQGGGVTSGASVQTNSNTGNSLSTGLVGYWTFDGKNMTSNVADSSGTGNTGYLRNFNSTTTTFGKIGQALKFDGANDYVALSNPSSLNIAGSLSISAWIMPTSFPGGNDNDVLRKGGSGGVSCQYSLAVTRDNGPEQIGFDISKNGSGTCAPGANNAIRYTTTTINPNVWYHIVGVYNATAQTMNTYVNGVLDNGTLSGTVPAIPFTSSDVAAIGSGVDAASLFFAGNIDDVRIYNRVLTAAEVARLYQLGK